MLIHKLLFGTYPSVYASSFHELEQRVRDSILHALDGHYDETHHFIYQEKQHSYPQKWGHKTSLFAKVSTRPL